MHCGMPGARATFQWPRFPAYRKPIHSEVVMTTRLVKLAQGRMEAVIEPLNRRLALEPIPVHVATIPTCLDDCVEVEAVAKRDGCEGRARTDFSSLAVLFCDRGWLATAVEHELEGAIGRALDGWLLQSEAREGWPPRECVHN